MVLGSAACGAISGRPERATFRSVLSEFGLLSLRNPRARDTARLFGGGYAMYCGPALRWRRRLTLIFSVSLVVQPPTGHARALPVPLADVVNLWTGVLRA